MRTTLTLDDDILATTKAHAPQRGVSLGKVVSELAAKVCNPAWLLPAAMAFAFSLSAKLARLAPSRVTDIYLLTLAVRNRALLTTFDRRIPLDAVPAGAAHFCLLVSSMGAASPRRPPSKRDFDTPALISRHV